jgi:hypothetical protein
MIRPFAIALLIFAASPAEAAIRWPWDHPRRAVHHHRHRVAPTVAQPLNCDRINESVKVLTPKNLDRALRESTTKQRETIDDCSRESR